MLTLVLGGARSGKSGVAEVIAKRCGPDVIYVATGVATDDDMATRIAAHKLRRSTLWETIESTDLVATVDALPDRPALIDSLGTWVASTHDFVVDIVGLVDALGSRTSDTIVVSDEVGLGVHPETAVGRAWRDALGEVNQAVAAIADDVLLVVAGRTLRFPGPGGPRSGEQ